MSKYFLVYCKFSYVMFIYTCAEVQDKVLN